MLDDLEHMMHRARLLVFLTSCYFGPPCREKRYVDAAILGEGFERHGRCQVCVESNRQDFLGCIQWVSSVNTR